MSVIFSKSAFTTARTHGAHVIIDETTGVVVKDRVQHRVGRLATELELTRARINAQDDDFLRAENRERMKAMWKRVATMRDA
jgi:hypothetical protein